jgi:hypothetical protein
MVSVEPLEGWVLEAVLWVGLLDSSPWLRQDALVVRGKSVNFFRDSIVSNISCFVMMLVVVLVLLLGK